MEKDIYIDISTKEYKLLIEAETKLAIIERALVEDKTAYIDKERIRTIIGVECPEMVDSLKEAGL